VTKLVGLIALLCAAPVAPLGVVVWIALPDLPAYGITTTAIGAAFCLVGGLLMWLGRHAPPVFRTASPTPSTELTAVSTIVDGVLDLLS